MASIQCWPQKNVVLYRKEIIMDDYNETKIYKFTLSILKDCVQEIEMPIGSRIVSVSLQGDKVALHCICPVKVAPEKRKFNIKFTGETIDVYKELYIGVVQKNGFVLHVVEIGREMLNPFD